MFGDIVDLDLSFFGISFDDLHGDSAEDGGELSFEVAHACFTGVGAADIA